MSVPLLHDLHWRGDAGVGTGALETIPHADRIALLSKEGAVELCFTGRGEKRGKRLHPDWRLKAFVVGDVSPDTVEVDPNNFGVMHVHEFMVGKKRFIL